jgi:hypothetical protein
MKLVVSPRAAEYIAANGGEAWVWLDPHRGIVGSHIWLETHCEPPRSSRRSSFTRSSRRPHRFRTTEHEGITLHYDFGRMNPPEELHVDRKGWRRGTYRLESYWNGSIFVGDDIPVPGHD